MSDETYASSYDWWNKFYLPTHQPAYNAVFSTSISKQLSLPNLFDGRADLSDFLIHLILATQSFLEQRPTRRRKHWKRVLLSIRTHTPTNYAWDCGRLQLNCKTYGLAGHLGSYFCWKVKKICEHRSHEWCFPLCELEARLSIWKLSWLNNVFAIVPMHCMAMADVRGDFSQQCVWNAITAPFCKWHHKVCRFHLTFVLIVHKVSATQNKNKLLLANCPRFSCMCACWWKISSLLMCPCLLGKGLQALRDISDCDNTLFVNTTVHDVCNQRWVHIIEILKWGIYHCITHIRNRATYTSGDWRS